MERAEDNRHSRARVAETTKGASRHATPCNAGRAGAHRPWEALHPTRSSDVLTRIARERVPTAPQVRKRVDRGPTAAAGRPMLKTSGAAHRRREVLEEQFRSRISASWHRERW